MKKIFNIQPDMKYFQKIFTALLFGVFILGGISFTGITNTFAAETNSASSSPSDVVYHQTTRRADLTTFGNFSPVQNVGSLGEKILKLLLGVLGGVGLLGIIVGGFIIMSSSGDDTLLDRGKTILIYSCIGVSVALLALGLTTLVQTVFYSVGT